MRIAAGKVVFSLILLTLFLGGVLIVPMTPPGLSNEAIVTSDHIEIGPDDVVIDEEALAEKAQQASRSQFYENLGQIDNVDVLFYGDIPSGIIGFAESRVHLWMEGAESSVVLLFEGASAVIPRGVGEVRHRSSYFLGCRGIYTGIRGFASVVFDDLWPGIGLVYRATADGAKYEFQVTPGADPADIRVRCEDADSIVIGKNSVRIKKGDGTLVDDGLRIFQGTTDVDGKFVFLDDRVFGFSVTDYDVTKLLIIDPLLYSTYLPGNVDEQGGGISVDSSGNVYVTGSTQSTDFPTVNAYNSSHNGGGWDVFVFKLSSDGSSLLYSTYVGGSGSDIGWGIAVDGSGNTYVTGWTMSTDFPAVNAYNASGNGNLDVFVFKLSSDGSSLLYSTYVGGSGSDIGWGIAVDSTGNVTVTGQTQSANFPTMNAYNGAASGYNDVFVFKLSSDGSSLLYSTYVGGSHEDTAKGMTVDSVGNAYVTGWTMSTDFPMVNALDTTGDGTNGDAFVFKLAANGSSLLYSTYSGGAGEDEGYGIAVDNSGNAYVTGSSQSDVIVFKLSSDGSSLLYSISVGGSSVDTGCGVVVDGTGNAYVTGRTGSTNFPTVNTYVATGNGTNGDAFVFKLSSDGSSLLYSTHVGGSHWDEGNSIAIDDFGNIYVTGYTHSLDFPTVNAYNATGDGSTTYSDVFVFKMIEDYTIPDLDSPSDIIYEQGTTGNSLTWTVGDMTPYRFCVEGNGSTVDWTAWSNGSIIVDVDGLTVGAFNFTIIVVDRGGNVAQDTVFVTVEDATSPDLDSPDDFTYEAGVSGNQITWTAGDLNPAQYRVSGNGTVLGWTAWSNGSIVVDVDGHSPGVYNYTIIVRDDHGNQAVNTVFVTVEDTTSPDLSSPDDLLYEQGNTGNEIVWTATDFYPGQYRIDGNGTTVGWTAWSNDPITVNVDGFSLGVYSYIITVRDDNDNEVIDTVFVIVVDSTGPEISDIQQSPSSPMDNETVTVTAIVTDVISNVASVILYYTILPQGGEWSDLRNITMVLQTGDTYRGTIPILGYATQVEYYIWSVDGESNAANTSSFPGAYTVRSSDFIGPEIELSHSPLQPTELEYVVVTALVEDQMSVGYVILQYSIDAGVRWTNVTMDQSGVQWSCALPRQEVGVTVHIRVHARDTLGNWASATDSYEVVSSNPPPDPMSLVILGAEVVAGIGAVLGAAKGFQRWKADRARKELTAPAD